jgi:hypothetical protein
VERSKSLRRILGDDLTAKGSLNEFELIKAQAGNATVVGMFDFTFLAVGRASEV